jgi:hypothetical protein
MTWNVKRRILDLRADPPTPTWYFLTRDGSWDVDVRKARAYRNVHAAEDVVKYFGADDTRVVPEE